MTYRASMLLPGVTGEVVRLKGSQAEGDNIEKTWWREWSNRQDSKMVPGSEPMSDAVIFEPIPYRSALRENCTHIIAVRTRADNVSVTVKMSVMEKLIMTRFFGRKQKMPELVNWMLSQYHKLVYAEDVLLLNDYNRDYNAESEGPKILCIALPAGTVPEVKRFETSRSVIFNSVRQGFAAGYDSLVLDPALRGRGWEVARQVYPDSIMDQIPTHILLQMQQEQDQEIENPTGIKELKINSILNNDVTKLDRVPGDGVMKSDNDDSEDGEDNDGNSDKKDVGGKTEEEIEEADFVSWFGSLKEDEAVSPKEEAVQEALMSAVGSTLSTSKREALVSGLKRLQAIILGLGVPDIALEKAKHNKISLILSPTVSLKSDELDDSCGGEEGFYF